MSRGTVLVVEDEPRLRTIIKLQLMQAGFDVIDHDSGEKALETLERQTPDLVLVNILLSGMDGIQVCERIRASAKLARLPVIFLTAKKDAESRARCMTAGASDYIIKPWDAEDLVLRIEGALASKRANLSRALPPKS